MLSRRLPVQGSTLPYHAAPNVRLSLPLLGTPMLLYVLSLLHSLFGSSRMVSRNCVLLQKRTRRACNDLILKAKGADQK